MLQKTKRRTAITIYKREKEIAEKQELYRNFGCIYHLKLLLFVLFFYVYTSLFRPPLFFHFRHERIRSKTSRRM